MDFRILNHPWNKTYLVRMDDCFNVFLDYIDGFSYIKPSLHPWNKTYLVRMDDFFNVFLDQGLDKAVHFLPTFST